MEADENSELDTSTEAIDESPAPDTGSGEPPPDTGGEQPPPPSDWRVTRYGDDWQNSIDYHRDTTKYLRGELDKAKKQRAPQRGIEDDPAPKQAEQPASDSPYAKVQTVDEFGRTIEQRFESKLAERERDLQFRSSIQAVRDKEQGDPKRGIPSFSEIEQEVLIPAFEKNPAIKDLIRQAFPNAGQALYTLGFLLKYNSVDALERLFAGKARQEMGDKIDEVSREAVRLRGGKDTGTNGKLTPKDIWGMSKADFERLEARNTGRTT